MIFPLLILGLTVAGVYAYKRSLRTRAVVAAQAPSQTDAGQPQIRRVQFPITRVGNEAKFLPSVAYDITDDKRSAFVVAKQLPVDIVFSTSGDIPPIAQVFPAEGNEHFGGRLSVDREITVRVNNYARPIDSEGNYGDDGYSAMVVANTAGHNNDMRVFVEEAPPQ